MNSYDLSRSWFDWCFENPERINPNHSALYFFCIEHCNRLGWKEKFGLPTSMAKEAIGIRSYNTYKKTLDELVDFGFIRMIEISKNQHSSNIVALSNFNKALDKADAKALDKALQKHSTKQVESTQQSISSIDKQVTIEQYNKEQGTVLLEKETKDIPIKKNDFDFSKSSNDFKDFFLNEFIVAPKQKKKSKELLKKILIDLQSYDEPFAIGLMKNSVLNNWQGYKFDKTDEQYADYLRKKQNGNNPQWTNGAAAAVQRPAGKQPFVFSGAEFSAKMQERFKIKEFID